MEKVPKDIFTKEFKEEAVKMVTEGGLTIPEVGRRLSILRSTLAHWVKIAKEGRLTAGKQKLVTGEQMELARLRREVAELKMERDILKYVEIGSVLLFIDNHICTSQNLSRHFPGG